MKYLPLLLLLLAGACTHRREPMLHEKGEVVAMQYAPPIDGSGTTTTFNSNGGIGMGHTSIHGEEKYMVVFRCEHAIVFSIDKKELFYKLKQGDTVQIDYYEIIDGDGAVKSFDFIDANKISR